MATRPYDYRVILDKLDPQEVVLSLQRVHNQYIQSLATSQTMIFVHHQDLAHLIVLASMWVQEGR